MRLLLCYNTRCWYNLNYFYAEYVSRTRYDKFRLLVQLGQTFIISFIIIVRAQIRNDIGGT